MKIRHNADPHVDFLGTTTDGFSYYNTHNGRTLTGGAWGRREDARAFLGYRAQLPDQPRCSPAQRRWWELRNVCTGGLIHTPERYRTP